MKLVVVDCGSGNLASADRALRRAASDIKSNVDVVVSSDPKVVARADRLVLPGQGAFAVCARELAAVNGLHDAILEADARSVPFLGICVGMQMMAERGLEHEATAGFGWVEGQVTRMDVKPPLRLPQMGWNELLFEEDVHPVLNGIGRGAHVYFVHSYALQTNNRKEVFAETYYGGRVPAVIGNRHRVGMQFHVEKSQAVGLRMLTNFLAWSP